MNVDGNSQSKEKKRPTRGEGKEAGDDKKIFEHSHRTLEDLEDRSEIKGDVY